jgi:hypothetical protein
MPCPRRKASALLPGVAFGHKIKATQSR